MLFFCFQSRHLCSLHPGCSQPIFQPCTEGVSLVAPPLFRCWSLYNQNLSCQQGNVTPSTTDDLVHRRYEPLLPYTYSLPITSCDNLLCAACEIFKATTAHSTQIGAPWQMVLRKTMFTQAIAIAVTISFHKFLVLSLHHWDTVPPAMATGVAPFI